MIFRVAVAGMGEVTGEGEVRGREGKGRVTEACKGHMRKENGR